jgi:dihydrofolate synthase/folylpolyglutamate synthase
MVLGMMNTKDPAAYVKALKGRVAALRTVTIPDEPNALNENRLAEAAGSVIVDVVPSASVEMAVKGLVGGQPGPARILIAGSLYLAGQVLAENG